MALRACGCSGRSRFEKPPSDRGPERDRDDFRPRFWLRRAVTAAGAGVMILIVVAVTQLPPRGQYLAHEVGRLAGVSGPQVGQWARNGYIRSSQSDGLPRIYSFQDVAEAMV